MLSTSTGRITGFTAINALVKLTTTNVNAIQVYQMADTIQELLGLAKELNLHQLYSSWQLARRTAVLVGNTHKSQLAATEWCTLIYNPD